MNKFLAKKIISVSLAVVVFIVSSTFGSLVQGADLSSIIVTNSPDYTVLQADADVWAEAEAYVNSYGTISTSDRESVASSAYTMAMHNNNEWTEWNLNVPASGDYNVVFRYATARTTEQNLRYNIKIGTDETDVQVPGTGGWGTESAHYRDVFCEYTFSLSSGSNTIRFTRVNEQINFDWIGLVKVETPGAVELLTNGDFEDGLTSWSAYLAATVTEETSVINSGQKAVKVTDMSSQAAGIVQDITSLIQTYGPGEYNISSWIRTLSANATGEIFFILNTSNGTQYPGNATASVNSSSWTKLSSTVNVTWTGTLNQARFIVRLNGSTADFYADDCSILFGTVDPILVTGITVSSEGDATTVTDGQDLQMYADVLPVDATDSSVNWTIESGTGDASITAGGLLTGTSVGTVTVKATANDGSEIDGTMQITVEEAEETGEEILTNGNFDIDLTGWSTYNDNSIAEETNEFRSGQSIRVYDMTANWEGIKQDITSQIQAKGQGEYTVGAYIKMASGSANLGQAFIQLNTNEGAEYLPDNENTPVNSSTWTKLSYNGELSWTGTLNSAILIIRIADSTADYYVDDASVISFDGGTTPPPSGSGIQYDGLWEGSLKVANQNMSRPIGRYTNYNGYAWIAQESGYLNRAEIQIAHNFDEIAETTKSAKYSQGGHDQGHTFPVSWNVEFHLFELNSSGTIVGSSLKTIPFTFTAIDPQGDDEKSRVIVSFDLSEVSITQGTKYFFAFENKQQYPNEDYVSINAYANTKRGSNPVDIFHGNFPVMGKYVNSTGYFQQDSAGLIGLGVEMQNGNQYGGVEFNATASGLKRYVGSSNYVKMSWTKDYSRTIDAISLGIAKNTINPGNLIVNILENGTSIFTESYTNGEISNSTSGTIKNMVLGLGEGVELSLEANKEYTVVLSSPTSGSEAYIITGVRHAEKSTVRADSIKINISQPSGIDYIQPHKSSGLAMYSTNGGSSWVYAAYNGDGAMTDFPIAFRVVQD